MDLKLTAVDASFSISPTSALGLIWLQAHFPASEWGVLLSGNAVFSADCVDAMVADAEVAGLAVAMPARVRSLAADPSKRGLCLVL